MNPLTAEWIAKASADLATAKEMAQTALKAAKAFSKEFNTRYVK